MSSEKLSREQLVVVAFANCKPRLMYDFRNRTDIPKEQRLLWYALDDKKDWIMALAHGVPVVEKWKLFNGWVRTSNKFARLAHLALFPNYPEGLY